MVHDKLLVFLVVIRPSAMLFLALLTHFTLVADWLRRQQVVREAFARPATTAAWTLHQCIPYYRRDRLQC